MIDLSDVESVRSALAQMCRNPAMRVTGRLHDVPNRWEPMTVREPDTQMYFTDDGAWHFIADLLVSGAQAKCIPPSDKFPDFAYYLVEATGGFTLIYMKVALQKEVKKVIGLSFHYSDPR